MPNVFLVANEPLSRDHGQTALSVAGNRVWSFSKMEHLLEMLALNTFEVDILVLSISFMEYSSHEERIRTLGRKGIPLVLQVDLPEVRSGLSKIELRRSSEVAWQGEPPSALLRDVELVGGREGLLTSS